MQTGKSTHVRARARATWGSFVANIRRQHCVLKRVCERMGVCLMSAVYRYNNVCACAVSHACILACACVWGCVHACVRRPWSEAMSEAGDASCFAWSVNLTSKLHLYVCMYSPVNSVTQRPCGYVLLYLPSKTAVLLDLLIVLYILTFCFHSTGNLKDCCTCK